MQSTRDWKARRRTDFHVAMIMDGNGRWATRRGLPRIAGHRAGVETVRRIVEAAPGLGITKLTLFAFSSDNWRRPPDEVGALMALAADAISMPRSIGLIDSGIRLTVIGRRDRLPAQLVAKHRRRRSRHRGGTSSSGFGSRSTTPRATPFCARPRARRRRIVARHLRPFHRPIDGDDDSAPEVDLLIRTGGEKRLSDFLLWESAYAELWFTDRMWPEFSADDLKAAVDEFRRRERRFGGLAAPAPSVAAATADRSNTFHGERHHDQQRHCASIPSLPVRGSWPWRIAIVAILDGARRLAVLPPDRRRVARAVRAGGRRRRAARRTGSTRAAASCCIYGGILVAALLPSLEDFNVMSALIAVLGIGAFALGVTGGAQRRS